MKKIEAIIRPSVFEDVQRALERCDIGGLTVSEVFGFGKEPGEVATYRGASYPIASHARLRLEIVVSDAQAGPVALAVAQAARTGRVGDGLVTLFPVEEAVRVRTAERGDAAVATSHAGADVDEPSPEPAVRRVASGLSPW